MIVPTALGNESCESLVALVRARGPASEIVAVGESCPRRQLWSLRHAGVSGFVACAGSMAFEALVQRHKQRLVARTHLNALGRQLVGLEPMKDAQERLRAVMFDEAFRQSAHNKNAAARARAGRSTSRREA